MIEHIDRHRFYPGDCRDLLAQLEDNSVDAVVTDPPYGLSKPPPIDAVLRAWIAGEDYRHSSKGFMGRTWDSLVPGPAIWRQVFRVLKPGGYALVAAGTRTVDMMGIALRLSGFEVRDTVHWCYWSGFPKNMEIGAAIDKDRGLERRIVGNNPTWREAKRENRIMNPVRGDGAMFLTEAACDESRQWSGWGTGIKPAVEPFLLVRKPLDGTYVENLRKWGTGALNIDGCRFGYGDAMWPGPKDEGTARKPSIVRDTPAGFGKGKEMGGRGSDIGRFPANLIHVPKASRSERERWCDGLQNALCSCKPHEREAWENEGRSQAIQADSAAPQSRDTIAPTTNHRAAPGYGTMSYGSKSTGQSQPATTSTTETETSKITESEISNCSIPSPTSAPIARTIDGLEADGNGDAQSAENGSGQPKSTTTSTGTDGSSMGAAVPAISRASSPINASGERCGRCGKLWPNRDPNGPKQLHSTVKPLALMQWLCRLVTPPAGSVLDPFLGSGTTALAAHLEGFTAIGAEMTYPEIPRVRLGNLTRQQEIAPVSSYAGPDLRVVELPDVEAPKGEDGSGEQLSLIGGE